MINEILGITVHNTGNNLSAKENFEKIKILGWNEYHYLIDDKEIIKLHDDNVVVHHTGKGFDTGNMNTIAVAICKSTTANYYDAENKAIEFIKKLMKKHKLKVSDIYFHCEWNVTTYCPHRILDEFTKKEWIERRFINVK